jgi:hypothetical protein
LHLSSARTSCTNQRAQFSGSGSESSRRESFQASWVPEIINSAMMPNSSRMHLHYAHSLSATFSASSRDERVQQSRRITFKPPEHLKNDWPVRTPWKQTKRLWKGTTSYFPHRGITGQDRLLCELGNQAFLVNSCRSPRHFTSGNTARASSQDTPFAYGSVKCMLTKIRGRAIINATVPRHGDAVLIPQRQPRLETVLEFAWIAGSQQLSIHLQCG